LFWPIHLDKVPGFEVNHRAEAFVTGWGVGHFFFAARSILVSSSIAQGGWLDETARFHHATRRRCCSLAARLARAAAAEAADHRDSGLGHA
jgi:hypothetical protein